MVLWVITLLTVMATTYGYSTRTETAAVRNRLDATKARYLAEAGVQRALYALTEPAPESRWPIDGTEKSWSTADGVVHVSVRNVTGLININGAGAELLGGILRVIGLETERRRTLTAAILDWRDPDSLRVAGGAEDMDYAAALRSYDAKDAPFHNVDELQLVLGMTAATFQKVEPYLTVHGGHTEVNPQFAPREVLLAMPGLDAQRRDSMLAYRSNTGTAGVLSPGTGTFRVAVQAELPSGARHSLRAVIQVRSGPVPQFTVLSWKENG